MNDNSNQNQNQYLYLWETLAKMDSLLQKSITSIFIPCCCRRNAEMNLLLHHFSEALSTCSRLTVFGVSVEERYPALYHDLQEIHEAVENLLPVLNSQCNNRYQRMYHALLNFRSCLLFFRWREGWFFPEEMMQTSFSVFSMFEPMYFKIKNKNVLNSREWAGLSRLIQVAWAERELMLRTQILIQDLKTGQISRIIQKSFDCINEMEYAAEVESKNHFQRNYKTLMGLYKPWHEHQIV